MPDDNGTIDAAVQDGNDGKVETLGDLAGGLLKFFVTPHSLTRVAHDDFFRRRYPSLLGERLVGYASVVTFDVAKTLVIYGGAVYLLCQIYQFVANR